MALIQANSAIDMIDPVVWTGELLEASATRLIISDGVLTAVYGGEGLTYSTDAVTGGTVTYIQIYSNETLVVQAESFSFSAVAVRSYILANDIPSLLEIGLAGSDIIAGSTDSDRLAGFGGDDLLVGDLGVNTIDGGAGLDYAAYSGARSNFQVDATTNAIFLTSADARIDDTLRSVERLLFDDGFLAFDAGAAAGYRLYQAAFDRVPDLGGLSYWVDKIDEGTTLQSAAASFIDSAEFRSLYGNNPTDEAFVDLLYANVLNRSADAGGYDYWLGRMDGGLSRSEVLAEFSESQENKVNVAGAIADGIWLDSAYFA